MPLIAELKRRNVFRVGAAYAIAAWLLDNSGHNPMVEIQEEFDKKLIEWIGSH